MQHKRFMVAFAAVALALSMAAIVPRVRRMLGPQVVAQPVAGNVYLLVGKGGNIAVSVGSDGTLIVDNQFPELADKLEAAIDDLGGSTPKIVINTHHHNDHTGGNPHFGTAGTIIAHDNVRVRLASEKLARSGLPVVTFEDRLRVHFNDDEIEVFHLSPSHTDGDSAVWFKNSNVIHTGDAFINGRFPFIDVRSGGSLSGYVANLETLLRILPKDIQIIPGHGPVCGLQQVAETLEMIRLTRQDVIEYLTAGKNHEDIVTGGVDTRWASFGNGFVKPDRWNKTLLADIAGKQAR